MCSPDPRLTTALQAFKDWSNYLLIATVAAIGWIASENVAFSSPLLKAASLWSLALSMLFGILTLALIPLVAQQMDSSTTSIYKVRASYKMLRWPSGAYLTQACRPQHALFILGIMTFALDATTTISWTRGTSLVTGVVLAGAVAMAWWSKPGAEPSV